MLELKESSTLLGQLPLHWAQAILIVWLLWLGWTMTFSHPRLRGGAPVTVEGATRLAFDEEGKVCLHRDYFDLGAMLYEQLPLLGAVVRTLKGRLGA